MGACDMTCVGGAHCVPWNMKHVSTCNMRSGVMRGAPLLTKKNGGRRSGGGLVTLNEA